MPVSLTLSRNREPTVEEINERNNPASAQQHLAKRAVDARTGKPVIQPKQQDAVLQRAIVDELQLGEVQEAKLTPAQEAKRDFSQSDLHYVPSGWERDINIGKATAYLDSHGSTRVQGKKGGSGTPDPKIKDDRDYTLTVVAHGMPRNRRTVAACWRGKYTGAPKNETKTVATLANKAARIVNREGGRLKRINLYVCFAASNGIMESFGQLFTAQVDADKLAPNAEMIGRSIAVFVSMDSGPLGSGEKLVRRALN